MNNDNETNPAPALQQLPLWGNPVRLHGPAPYGDRSMRRSNPVFHDLSSPGPFEPTKAETVNLDCGMTVRAAFVVLARAGLAHLTANEAAILAGDELEGVHQMRIAIRRLRVLLAAFAPHLDDDAATFVLGELKWLQRKLGSARDWDVFLQRTMTPLMHRLPNEPELAHMRTAALDARQQAYLVVKETLQDRRYARFLMRFRLWLASIDLEDRLSLPGPCAAVPLMTFAGGVLCKRYRKLTRLGERGNFAEREMHKLRIQAKKMRYALELFRSLYRKKRARRFVRALGVLQNRLGSLQDAVVGRDLVAQIDAAPFVASREASAVAAVEPFGRATAMVVGFQTARINDDLTRFKGDWPRFADLKKFWRKAA